jgi:beta-lactamase regulating signal transducer with metallopeptidase domain
LAAAPIMPLFHKSLSKIFLISTGIKENNLFNFIYSFSSPGKSLLPFNEKSTPDVEQIVILIILIGVIISISFFLVNHLKIYRLKRRSTCLRLNQPKIFFSNDSFIPFIYNNSIVIPKSIPVTDREIIIRHESYHFKLAHHIDNLLVQIIQSVFWLNPFIYLLKREIFQLHEYQVDKLVVTSGIDPLDYKFVLIRCNAGNNKFIVANGLKNSNLKKRIIMMNTKISKKRSWKYLFLLPAFSVIFLSLSFSSIIPAPPSVLYKSDGQEVNTSDSVKINIVNLPEGFRAKDRNEVLIVLMNKASHIAIDGHLASASTVGNTIIEGYKSRLEKKYGDLKPSMINKDLKEVKIIVQKDRNTNENYYRELLNKISSAIYSLRDFYSQKLFAKSFKSLESSEIALILQLVPPVIYEAQPQMIKNDAGVKK